jgi:hypothetical protein
MVLCGVTLPSSTRHVMKIVCSEHMGCIQITRHEGQQEIPQRDTMSARAVLALRVLPNTCGWNEQIHRLEAPCSLLRQCPLIMTLSCQSHSRLDLQQVLLPTKLKQLSNTQHTTHISFLKSKSGTDLLRLCHLKSDLRIENAAPPPSTIDTAMARPGDGVSNPASYRHKEESNQ